MSQKLLKAKPVYVDTDTADKKIGPGAAAFIKNYRNNFNKNSSGTEGGNFGVGTPLQSTQQTVKVILPAGINKRIGGKEFEETNEYYFNNWNSNGNHGIYKINGNDLSCDEIIVDPLLDFSLDPRYQLSPDRIALNIIYLTDDSGNKTIFEKFYVFTDKNNWQRWINVQAGIATNGFNETDFPYFKVKYPFFDRKELIEYASRPPLLPPVFVEIPAVAADAGKQNKLLKTSTQLTYRYVYTDGRPTAVAAYSEPYYLVESACDINNQGLPRGLRFTLYAGGPHVEKIQILKRNCNNDFVIYDTIDKYDTCGDNSPEKIGTSYWKRTNPFTGFNYNEADNTITYDYYGDKESILFDNSATGDLYFQTELPIKSNSLADAGDAILMSNNLKFYNNFNCETLNNIQLSVSQKSADTGRCSIKTVKISCYAFIGAQGHQPQVVYKNGTENNMKFGGINYPKRPTTDPLSISNVFSEKYNLILGTKKGFIGYLAGTPYFSIGQQYIADSSGNLTFIDVIDASNGEQITLINNVIRDGGFFVQKFDFIVPAANYIFRIASHTATTSQNYQQTSTYVYCADRHQDIISNWRHNTKQVNAIKDFEINACNGDIDLWNEPGLNILVIYTPPPVGYYDSNERFIDGYFTESATEKIGWDAALYTTNRGDNLLKQTGVYTDHNGFFFAYSTDRSANQGEVFFGFYANCVFVHNRLFTAVGHYGENGFYSTNVNFADSNGGVVGEHNRLHIKGKISNCNGGTGISGVAVTPSGAQSFYSDGSGNYDAIVHPQSDQSVGAEILGSRRGRLFFNAGGQCLFSSCDCNCVSIIPFEFGVVSCISGQPIIYPQSVDKTLKLLISNINGPKGGGRYGVSIVGFDAAERANYAQLIDYVDIPTFLETGVFTPYQINWKAIGNLNLPAWVKSLSFFITRNLNYKSYLQWVGDKIEFIDTNGNIVADGSGAIRARVTIQSLLDFNLANNYATTVGYQFVQGDEIIFYDNGSGKLFTPDPVGGFMDYQILGSNFNESVQGQIASTVTTGDTSTTTTVTTPVTETDGKSFIIPYDSRLLALKDKCGFWIELIRPKGEAELELYSEITNKYPVINGELINNLISGTLNFFDTYYQRRDIIISNCSGTALLHPFESSSITDFWGSDCPSTGRVTARDPEVKQYWDEQETTKSDEKFNNGRVNGIGVFRGKRSRFPGEKRGGIVAVHVEEKIILFICENDVFVTSYNEKFVQVQANSGYVTSTLDQIIGDPSKKAGITHGCAEEDRGTIGFEKGIAWWLDRKNATPIIFDYEQGPYKSTKPEEISEENKSYFLNKITYLVNFNKKISNPLLNLIETSSGYDPKNNDIIFTFRPRMNLNSNPQYFVNNEREVKIPMQETFVFNLDQKKWVNFTGFTPEGYGTLRSAISGQELISFVNGLPYFHNSENFANFNTFYGIKTETVIDLAFSGIESQFDDKAKVFQSALLQLKGDVFFVDKIITDNPRTFSYIPLFYWNKKFNIWFATMLGDGNTYPDPNHKVPSQLIDGHRITAFYARIRFVKGPETLDQYFELDKIAVRICGSEKTDK